MYIYIYTIKSAGAYDYGIYIYENSAIYEM